MTHVSIIGIGTGNPEHLSLQGVKALGSAQAIISMDKAARGLTGANILEDVREQIISEHAPADIRKISIPDPKRDATNPNYEEAVAQWHNERRQRIAAAIEPFEHVAYLAWGDPSLYDSALRIFEKIPGVTISIIPGITAIQALCAAHTIPLNRLGAPITITTGRKLRERTTPLTTDTVVMLDGEDSWLSPAAADCDIYWGAYVAMDQEVLLHGSVADIGQDIAQRKAALREEHGWIMDIYLLRV
ncbi:MAG: precorrin-6A synthase (deacetylating) [Corynebacterium sp.]|nr:precorrin-6A synthase (deacetylating) [Corynebacterium sp.]